MTVRKILIAVDLSALASDVIRYGCRIATVSYTHLTLPTILLV